MNKVLVLTMLAGSIACGCHSTNMGATRKSATQPAMTTASMAASPATMPIGATETSAVQVTKAPPMDGTLTSPIWLHAPLLVLGSVQGKSTPLQTSARILFDDKNMYVAWQCVEKDTASVAAKFGAADRDIWRDDCVELFVSPDGKTYYHFAANSRGALSGATGNVGDSDADWSATKATAKAAIDKNQAWSVTMCIPLKDLAPRSGQDQTWMLNLNRTKPGEDENWSSWSESSWSRNGRSNYGDARGWGRITGVNIP